MLASHGCLDGTLTLARFMLAPSVLGLRLDAHGPSYRDRRQHHGQVPLRTWRIIILDITGEVYQGGG